MRSWATKTPSYHFIHLTLWTSLQRLENVWNQKKLQVKAFDCHSRLQIITGKHKRSQNLTKHSRTVKWNTSLAQFEKSSSLKHDTKTLAQHCCFHLNSKWINRPKGVWLEGNCLHRYSSDTDSSAMTCNPASYFREQHSLLWYLKKKYSSWIVLWRCISLSSYR